MSRSPPPARKDRGPRLPIGYRILTREDGTLAVVLEIIDASIDVPLSPVHRRGLDDYRAVRRAVRAYNRELRAARPE